MGLAETSMNVHYLPLPLYEHVRDHLEQALAIVPRDDDTAVLRLHIEEAIEIALERAYRRRPPDRLASGDNVRPFQTERAG